MSEQFGGEYLDSKTAMGEIMARKQHRRELRLMQKEKQYAELRLGDDWAERARQLYADHAEMGESQDFATCERPDGSRYGTAGQCRKGKEVSPEDLGVKMPKSPGAGPMPESAVAEAHKKAKGYGGSWGDAEETLFQSVYAKAENTKHLGAIHRAVVKADDEGDIDAKPGAFLAMKKAMDEQLKLNMRSGVGAKREKELAAMTPEQRRKAETEERIKRGIKAGVVNPRMR